MWLSYFMGLIALLCLYLEFFMPGGILALVSLVFMIVGTSLFFYETSELWMGAVYLSVLLGLSLLVSLLALKMIKRSKDQFCLHKDQEGFSSSVFTEELTGKEGFVSTELKPSGHVRIEGKIYQALSQGDFISKNCKVEVVSMKGSYLVVKLKKEGIDS